MNFFSTLLKKRNLKTHDGRPLWKYFLSHEELNNLKETLQYAHPISIDPRDVALYYAYWWSKSYEGGKPSKSDVFSSLGGNIQFYISEQKFYKLARKGAQILGVKWVKKQYTLYFRTLLLQGGLPLKQISENHGNYKSFLEAVLQEQPDVIEDFIFKPYITQLLPKSSQNEVIYENCLDIVKSILREDEEYKDLLESEESLKSIARSLKIILKEMPKKSRLKIPKNYWLLSYNNNRYTVNLKLGLADKYSKDDISNILGFEASQNNYQLYLDDELICVFRRLSKDNFKTDWYDQNQKKWDISRGQPETYVICNNIKSSLPDFIQTLPDLNEPTLWSKFDDNLWRYSKSNAVPNEEALLIFPKEWSSTLPKTEIELNAQALYCLAFEGEISIQCKNAERTYLCSVNSIDWVIESGKPEWLLKPNLKVVQGVPKVHVYNEDGDRISNSHCNILIKKHNTNEIWKSLSEARSITKGCFDIRIEKDGIIAYDTFFNIGNIRIEYLDQRIYQSSIKIENLDLLTFLIQEHKLLTISEENDLFDVKLNSEFSKIATSLKASLGFESKKKLFFELSPFKGMTITDKEGKVIKDNEELSISNLYGMRIMSSADSNTLIKIYNKLKPDVIVRKIINEAFQPLISFKDEISRLFYLADALDYQNTVTLELSDGNSKKKYSIKGFSHMLDVSHQYENKLTLLSSDDELELFAVPLNCKINEIEIIPLLKVNEFYQIPTTTNNEQFIVISSFKDNKQLMPRYVNLNHDFESEKKDTRINYYHDQLLTEDFTEDIWNETLSYFKICENNDLPFSTFDQLRAISGSSKVAAEAFFYLGFFLEPQDYIQKIIPRIEKELSFCFHWISKNDWENAINKIVNLFGDNFYNKIFELFRLYMDEFGLQKLFKYISSEIRIEADFISHRDIRELRSKLGYRVLSELPKKFPYVLSDYHIPIDEHYNVKLLILSPIAVAESIASDDLEHEYSIWGGDEKREVIRRNIQYTQYLVPDFYSKVIYHVLKNI